MVSHEGVSTAALEICTTLRRGCIKCAQLAGLRRRGQQVPHSQLYGSLVSGADWGSEWAFLISVTGHQANIMQFLDGGDKKGGVGNSDLFPS